MFHFEPPPPTSPSSFSLWFCPPLGRRGGGGHFQATKAGLGQQALMFILADCSPYCLAFFCVCPGTTSPPPCLAENNPPEAFFCAWPRVRGCPVLKPLTHKHSSIPPPLFPPFLLPQLCAPFYLLIISVLLSPPRGPHSYAENMTLFVLWSESRERCLWACDCIYTRAVEQSPTSESPADQSLIQNMIQSALKFDCGRCSGNI